MQLANNLFDPSPIQAFLPSKLAKLLPALTTANLPTLLATFNISKNTRMAAIMATATYLCEIPALPENIELAQLPWKRWLLLLPLSWATKWKFCLLAEHPLQLP